jgi:hypothetical protein
MAPDKKTIAGIATVAIAVVYAAVRWRSGDGQMHEADTTPSAD